jgi:hemolysin D
MLNGLASNTEPVLQRPSGASDSQFLEAQLLLTGQYAEYQSKLALLAAEINKKQAEQRSTQEIVNKLQRSLPISQQRAAKL